MTNDEIITSLKGLGKPIAVASELAPAFGLSTAAMIARLQTSAVKDGLVRYRVPSNGTNFSWVYPVEGVIEAVKADSSALLAQAYKKRIGGAVNSTGILERIERKLDRLLREIDIDPEGV